MTKREINKVPTLVCAGGMRGLGAEVCKQCTRESECFDIGANLIEGDNVQYFGAVQNKHLPRRVGLDINSNRNFGPDSEGWG